MEKEYVQSLILLIGGAQLPNESMKEYLRRVSLYTGVDFYSVRDAYYTGRLSKNGQVKFEKAAKSARQPHDLIAYTEHKLAIWRRHPDLYRPWIDAACKFLVEIRQHPGAPGELDSPDRSGHVAPEAGAA